MTKMKIHPLSIYMKYLINECYEEDHNPFFLENGKDHYCHNYTFSEWYFFYRKITHLTIKKQMLTPKKLLIGSEKYRWLTLC